MTRAILGVLLLVVSAVNAQVICRVTETEGCFEDNGDDNRLLTFVAAHQPGAMTQEVCASLCNRMNFTLIGVEYAYQCFCGNSYAYQPVPKPSDCTMKCQGNSSEYCGGNNRMFVYKAQCTGNPIPTGHAVGCMDSRAKDLPFCNSALPIAQRITDLIGRLTLQEKMGMMGADTKHTDVDTCSCMTASVDRLGIPGQLQIVETNSAVASSCVGPQLCATPFPGPTGMTATFNHSVWHTKGSIISTEMRALNNYNIGRGYNANAKVGLLGYGPNINLVRDPRFGRNSELPSEDPFLSGSYATHYVQGCQVGEDPRYLKMASGLKHYAAYSVETDRASRMFAVSTFDLFDSYLEQYKMAFSKTGGNAQAVMCSYAGVNGVPSCANDYLMNQVMRKAWDRNDVMVGSDCGAIDNMLHQNHYAKTKEQAAAFALNGGTDVNMGDSYYPPDVDGGNGALAGALSQKLTDEAHINQAVYRILEKRFLTGQFDPLEAQTYTRIRLEAVNSTATQSFVMDANLQSFVLLKNDAQTLPFSLSKTKKLAVVGPHIVSQRDLFEDYMGDEICAEGGVGCVQTIAQVFSRRYGADVTTTAKGVDLDSLDASGIAKAIEAVRAADQVVLCIGIGYDQEQETRDRKQTTLPGLQSMFAKLVLDEKKPTVVVLINGGMLAIDELIPYSPAIIEAFYPAMQGAEALYRAIFGLDNRWGKLPVTMYPASWASKTDFFSFDMTKAPGRTYRYLTEAPLFPFGWGLSYTTFKYDCKLTSASQLATRESDTNVACTVTNTGTRAGDEVLMIFHSASDDIRKKVAHPVPSRSLRGFERVHLAAGETRPVNFALDSYAFSLTTNDGSKVLYSGSHYLLISNGHNDDVKLEVRVPQALEHVVEFAPGH